MSAFENFLRASLSIIVVSQVKINFSSNFYLSILFRENQLFSFFLIFIEKDNEYKNFFQSISFVLHFKVI